MIPNSSASRNWKPKSQGWKGPWGAKRWNWIFSPVPCAGSRGHASREASLARQHLLGNPPRGASARRNKHRADVRTGGGEPGRFLSAMGTARAVRSRNGIARRHPAAGAGAPLLFYGYRRVAVLVQREGYGVGTKKVRRLMQEDNLLAVRRGEFVATTDSDHGFVVYPNLAQYLILTEVNQLWVADMTYLRLEGEFVYLAVVLDAFSRRAVGWALGRSLQTALPLAALDKAIQSRQPSPGMVHHSDRGSPYASNDYVKRLES